MMCPYPCSNKSSSGYCQTTACTNWKYNGLGGSYKIDDIIGAVDVDGIAEIVAEKALKIVLGKLDDGGRVPVVDQADIQHVGYTSAQMGYDK